MPKCSLLVFIFFISLGCQQLPTKVRTQEPIQTQSAGAEEYLQGSPVILDARPAFEYNLAHVPGAINVQWQDFSQQGPKARGLLQLDLFALSRRLALIGIDPDTPVLVLGKGLEGQGEEGRVAWTLKVLGVKSVKTLLYTTYRQRNSTQAAPTVLNKSYWKPPVAKNLLIEIKEFKNYLERGAKDVVLIDVRSPQEFQLPKTKHFKKIKIPVVNIPWSEFFDIRGAPKSLDDSFFVKNGVNKSATLLLISNRGVRSAAVTYALDSIGFKNIRNFAGGYEQWQ
jgi:thiosulfate/3-mercaptopyruvate sulfurtransferase